MRNQVHRRAGAAQLVCDVVVAGDDARRSAGPLGQRLAIDLARVLRVGAEAKRHAEPDGRIFGDRRRHVREVRVDAGDMPRRQARCQRRALPLLVRPWQPLDQREQARRVGLHAAAIARFGGVDAGEHAAIGERGELVDRECLGLPREAADDDGDLWRHDERPANSRSTRCRTRASPSMSIDEVSGTGAASAS